MSNHTLSAQEIANLIGGDLFISSSQNFTGINSLSEALAHEVSFLGNEKYYKDFLSTKSRLVIAPSLLKEAPEGIGVIHVENPTLAFSKVINHFAEAQNAIEFNISDHACISPSARIPNGQVAIMAGAIIGENVAIGKGCIIHAGAVLSNNVKLGEDTVIYQNVVLREDTVIGSNVRIQPGTVIGSDGFGYEDVEGRHVKIPQIGSVIIEDDVEIGANCTIDRARFGKTIIQQGTKIDNLVQVAHNVKIGRHNLLVAQCGISGSTETEEHVIIGPQSGTAGHLKIGKGVVIAGQSGLAKSQDEPGYYQGSPARPINDSRKSKALVNRLPKLLERIKSLEAKVKTLEED